MRKGIIVAIVASIVIVIGILLFIFNPTPDMKPVKIGYLPIYVDLPLFVAKERGSLISEVSR